MNCLRRNAELGGASVLFVMNTFDEADLIFMNADAATTTANFTTVTSRFTEYDTLLEKFLTQNGSDANLNVYATMECYNDYSPPILCLRNSGNARIDGEYRIAGTFQGKLYYVTRRYNETIYVYWYRRWRIGYELSTNNEIVPHIFCVTDGQTTPAVGSIMDCDEWVIRSSFGNRPMDEDFTVSRRRCGNECQTSVLRQHANQVRDELGSSSCIQFMVRGANQDDHACDCLKDLDAIGVHPIDDLGCTYGSVRLGNRWTECNRWNGQQSSTVLMSVKTYASGDACLSDVRSEEHYSGSCDTFLRFDENDPLVTYQYSIEYFCDFDRKQVGVVVYPFSFTCGADASEEQAWFYLNDTQCSGELSFEGHWDQAYIEDQLGVHEFLVEWQMCGTGYTTTAEPESDALSISLLATFLTIFMLL